ncbi:YgjV family protein [Saliniradius amylolyticus]|uniref:YgjV family protein n=1 Tax=Saliniradius amylolyticus TaxID=2183582 RepID=UPI0013A5B9C7|nr:YgjV family protein [Saliniradius amylolyticus]
MAPLLHALPVLLVALSFFSHNLTRLLWINAALCASMAWLFLYQSAWAGMAMMLVASGSSLYRLATQRAVTPGQSVMLILILTGGIFLLSYQSGSSWLTLIPAITFALYRYGELSCNERGLRTCIVSGSSLFLVYCWYTQTWGALMTEALFILSNSYYLYRLTKTATDNADLR